MNRFNVPSVRVGEVVGVRQLESEELVSGRPNSLARIPSALFRRTSPSSNELTVSSDAASPTALRFTCFGPAHLSSELTAR